MTKWGRVTQWGKVGGCDPAKSAVFVISVENRSVLY